MSGAAGPVGLLRISAMGPRTAAEVDRALAGLGAATAGLVLDLRGNPGGRLEAAVQVAERFLPPGAAIYLQRAGDGHLAARYARPGRRPRVEPLVVLVDGATASAAELLAGALATGGRACLAGSRSFGKGRVERLPAREPTPSAPGGPRPAGEFRLPDGRAVEGVGLVPDLPFETPAEAAAWLAGAARGRRSGCAAGAAAAADARR